MAKQWPGPSCFLGDFNSVCTPEERLRENIDFNSIDSFKNFINHANLIDQVLSNDVFTWEGPLGKFSRIDRVLINNKWALLWPDAILQSAPPDRSDHKPLIWAKVLVNWGPKPFRFNHSWLSKPGFLKFCEDLWNEFDVQGWAAFKIAKKLRLLKAYLKLWSSSHQNNDEVSLKIVEGYIKSLKMFFQQRDLSNSEILELAALKKRKKVLSVRIESKRRLHSRFKWLRLGDKNTHFFHIVSHIRQQSSYIAGMMVDNVWSDDPDVVKEATVTFFESLFKLQPSLSGLIDL
ncbi:uncharacterized protein [Rutidosis leptorrhynchoides]|uniref:uncharacterized protein n=1 Tax=Rutidosis leptorrhynchoides TaxID=125765 RepID=UPI003A995FAE